MEKKFIFCKDKETAEKLSQYYKLISKNQDGVFIFENKPINEHFDFSNINGKIAFSDKLLF